VTRHEAFVLSLKIFDHICSYDDVVARDFGRGTVGVLDVAGGPKVMSMLYGRFGTRIKLYMPIGCASFDLGSTEGLDFNGGAPPMPYDPMRTHGAIYRHLGKAKNEQLQRELWTQYKKKMLPLHKVRLHYGAEAVVALVGQLFANKVTPDEIHMCSLWPEGTEF